MLFLLIPKLSVDKKSARLLKKSLALCLALLLCAEPCLRAMPAPTSQVSKTPEFIRTFLDPKQQRVFGTAGTLEETYLPKALSQPRSLQQALKDPNLPLVILLQDAHGILSAQKNIGRLLNRVSKEGSLREPWIALEGTEPGEIDHQALSRIPDKNIRINTALHFMKDARMDGADYFTAAHAPQTRYFGIDSFQGIANNVQSYRELLEVRPAAQSFMDDWGRLLTQLKKHIYPADLYLFDQQVQSFQDYTQTLAMEKWLLLIQEFSNKFNLPLGPYPTLKAVCELNRNQPNHPEDKAEQVLTIEQQQLRNPLRANHFSDELQAWREALENQLTQDLPEARTLAAVSRTFQSHKHLLALSWTPREQTAFFDSKNLSLPKALSQTRFLRFLLRQELLALWQPSDLRAFYKARRAALRFYTAAQEREPVLETETQTLLSRAPNHKLFVILGGFHRDSFTHALREKQTAYLVLSPSITKDFSQQAYWRQLGGTSIKTMNPAVGLHLKLRAAWKNPAFSGTVAAHALRQASSQAPSAVFSNYKRWADKQSAGTNRTTDLYATLLPAQRSEVRSGSSSSLKPVSRSLDFADDLVPFYTALMSEFFSEAPASTTLPPETRTLFTQRYTQYLQTMLGADPKESTKLSAIGKQDGNTVKIDTHRRVLETTKRSGIYRLSFGVQMFTELADEDPEFAMLFFILSLHQYFTRPIIRQKSVTLFNALSTATLLNAFFGKTDTQPAVLTWDRTRRQKFLTLMAKQLQSAEGNAEFTQSSAKLLDHIAQVLKVKVPVMAETSILLAAETTLSTPTAETSSSSIPLSAQGDNSNLEWLQHIFQTGTVIGSGGFGVASTGLHPEIADSKIVAKLISPTFLKSASDTSPLSLPSEAVQRLTHEANALGRLDGQHAPKVFRRFIVDFQIPTTGALPEVERQLGFERHRGKTVPVAVIVMELVEGKNLNDILQALPKPSSGQVSRKTAAEDKKQSLQKRRWALALAKALQTIHQKGLLHRDIKPENLFLKDDKDGDTATVIDFGLSYARKSEANEKSSAAIDSSPTPVGPLEPTGQALVSPLVDQAPFFEPTTNALLTPTAEESMDTPEPQEAAAVPVIDQTLDRVEVTGDSLQSPLAKIPEEKHDAAVPQNLDLTQDGRAMGTPSYLLSTLPIAMTPLATRISEDKNVEASIDAWGKNFSRTEAPDLWALGAVLYYLFTGQTPSESSELKDQKSRNLHMQVVKKLKINATGSYLDPRQINAQMTPQEQYIILRLLGIQIPSMPTALKQAFSESLDAPQRFDAYYQPLQAYSNAAEAVRDLEALVTGKPLPSAPSRFFKLQKKSGLIKFQRWLDFIFRNWARDYTIHTLQPPEKILDRVAKARYLKKWSAAAAKPAVQDLAEKQNQAARQRTGWTVAATLATLFSTVAASFVVVISFAALAARLNPPAPPRAEAEIVYKEVLVPAPETEKPFEWSMDINNLLPYATVPQDPDDPKNTERVLKQKQNIQFLAYSSSVADPNPEEGNPDGRNYLARRAFNRLPNGYYPVEYAVNKIPIPIGIDTHAEITTSVFFKAESDNYGHGNLTLGMHDFENKTMRALFTFLTDQLAVGSFRLDRADPFTMDFDGGTDTAIRAAYDAARKNPLIQPNIPPNYWHPVKIIKYAQGEPLPDGTLADGKTAVFTIGEKDNPKSPLIVHPFRLVNNPADPWSETIQLTFYISGTQDFARQGPVEVTVASPKTGQTVTVESPNTTQPKTSAQPAPVTSASTKRSEVRQSSSFFDPKLAAVLPGDKTGLIWIEYTPANFESLSQQFLSKSAHAFRAGARVLFVQQRGTDPSVAISPDLRRRMNLYGAAFAETDVALEQQIPGSMAFENLLRLSQSHFGNSLGRPVILGNFTRGAPAASPLSEAQSVYYRVNLSKFTQQDSLAYRNAILLSASRLSRQYADPLEIIFNSDATVSVSESFVTWISQAYEQILNIAYSA